MTGPFSLRTAVDELYSNPMSEFTARRKTLAAAAKKAGDTEAAAHILGLRKPTLAADTVNRLVRVARTEIDELLVLGCRLREAEKALDGPELRKLSGRRRQLVNDLARLAFDITDQPAPSASVREGVISTLNAALADEDIADMLLSGALVTQARWDGFGATSLPELATVLPLDIGRRRAAAVHQSGNDAQADAPSPEIRDSAAGKVVPTAPGKAQQAVDTAAGKAAQKAAGEAAEKAKTAQKNAEREAAERARAEDEQRRRLESARAEAASAADVAAGAAQAVQAIDRRLGELSMQMALQRELLEQAQQTLRDAQTRSRAAHNALTRAGGSTADHPSPRTGRRPIGSRPS
ncbi:MAG: hypothetical protein ACR2M5_01700 [Nakamurella sp.]